MRSKSKGINLKSSSFKSPSLYNREKYKKLKHFYYPVNNTETTLLNSKIRYSPIKFNNNYNDLNSQKRHEQILKPNFKYLKGELKMNNLLELHDDKFNHIIKDEKNKINELDEEDLFNDNEEIENNYDNYYDGNIIQIHIPTGKNINKIFLSF